LPARRQNLLFSATFSEPIKALAGELLVRPQLIEVAAPNATADRVAQRIVLVDSDRKRELLAALIQEGDWSQVLVFTRTKHGANRLAQQLEKAGIPAVAIHGNKSQNARTRALSQFKDHEVQVLVATDIAARGLDISQLPHVVNFELPNVPEDYVHRIGRTGRAGASGDAISLVSADELRLLADIEKVIGRRLDRETMPGFEPTPGQRAAPIPQRPQGARSHAPQRPARTSPGVYSKEPPARTGSPGRSAPGRAAAHPAGGHANAPKPAPRPAPRSTQKADHPNATRSDHAGQALAGVARKPQGGSPRAGAPGNPARRRGPH
jgi:ATP-dependent RNA helicase RhlE